MHARNVNTITNILFLIVVVVGAVKIVNKNIWHPYFLLICMVKHHIEIRKIVVNNSVNFVKNLQKRVNKVLKTHVFYIFFTFTMNITA